MGRNAILLRDGHVDQLIVVVGPDCVETVTELSIETSPEPVSLLLIGVSMVACVLTQVIESLGVLQHCTALLSECQKLIDLAVHDACWYVMPSESCFEFSPLYHVVSGCMKWSHHVRAGPRSCWVAKRTSATSEQSPLSSGNLDSTTLSQTSVLRGSSARVNNDGWVQRNS
jgi:hypothetical protein